MKEDISSGMPPVPSAQHDWFIQISGIVIGILNVSD
jgi:hypothetical protein